MKKNMILSSILVILLVLILTILGLNIKNQNKEYKELETKLKQAAIGYYGEKPSLISNNGTITSEELSNYDNTINMTIKEDICTGYVKTTSNMGIYEYKPYISCNNYQTKGYTK